MQVTSLLAQSVERKALNLVVVGSSPTVGVDVSAALLDNLWAALPIVVKSKKHLRVDSSISYVRSWYR